MGNCGGPCRWWCFAGGQLIRRYIDSARAKFACSMTMFLFSVFAMFAVFQMVVLTTPTDLAADTGTQVSGLIKTETASLNAHIDQLDEKLANPQIGEEHQTALKSERGQILLDRTQTESREQNLSQWLESDRLEFSGTLQSAGESDLTAAE